MTSRHDGPSSPRSSDRARSSSTGRSSTSPSSRSARSCRPPTSASLEGQTYVVSGYLAVLAALLILAGGLSDHYGRRRVFAIGLAGFGATSALCGLAPTLEWLVIFRLMQGAAGALLVPGSLSLITQAFSGAERGRAFGMWAASTSALTVLGPIVGGTMVDTIGWRSRVPHQRPRAGLRAVGDAAPRPGVARRGGDRAVRLARRARRGARRRRARVRAHPRRRRSAGATRSRGRDHGRGRSSLDPVPDPDGDAARTRSSRSSLFKSRAFATINLATFFIYGALYVNFRYTSLVFQGVLGYTATGAGADRPADRRHAGAALDADRHARRPDRRPPVPRGRPVPDGRRRCSGTRGCRPISEPWKARLEMPSTLIPPIDVLIDVLPGVLLFGLGISLRRRAADEHADGLDLGRASRAWAPRSTTRSRASASRSSGRSSSSRSARRSTRPSGRWPRRSTRRRPRSRRPSSRSTRRRPAPRPSRSARRPRRRSTPSTWRCSSRRSCS